MYDLNVKSKFIHFKAKGLTIKKISELMGINRTTLIQWNKELYTDIKIAERDEFEQIFETFFCEKRLRVELLAQELGACYKRLAEQEVRSDNLILLKEIEKLTKLLNMETDDKKYYSMMQKSEKTVSKKFPVIINDKDKFQEYDPTYRHEDESHLDLDETDAITFTEEEEEKMRKIEEEEKAKIEKIEEILLEVAEKELIHQAKENSVVAPKAETKRSKRIINKKPDMEVLKSKKGKRKNGTGERVKQA